MSFALAAGQVSAQDRRTLREYQRRSFRTRALKISLAVAFFFLFWAATPYYLPLKVDPDPAVAAANEAEAYQGNLSRQIAMPIVLGVSLFMLWRLPKRGRIGGQLVYVVAAYLAWNLISVAWSESPGTTEKRLVVLGINALLCWTLARTLSMVEIASLGFMAGSLTMVLSFVADAFVQHIFAPGDPDYRFTGVMTANYQAENLVLLILCALTLMQKRPRWTVWLGGWLVLVLGFLFLTRSRLSTIICLLLAGGMCLRLVRQRLTVTQRAMVYFGIAAVVLPGLIYAVGREGAGAAQSAFMMGRTDTENTSNLSNRAPLWAELWETGVLEHPWIGVGYDGFWTPARVEKISLDQGWMVPHAHDTYLDQTLSIGAIGALLYIGSLWGAAAIAWRRNYVERSAESLLTAALLTWVALTSVAESLPIDPYLPTILAYTCVVKMCLARGSEAASDAAFDREPLLRGEPLPELLVTQTFLEMPRRPAAGVWQARERPEDIWKDGDARLRTVRFTEVEPT